MNKVQEVIYKHIIGNKENSETASKMLYDSIKGNLRPNDVQSRR